MRHAMCQWIALSACVCLLSLGGAHNARAASAAQIRYVAPGGACGGASPCYSSPQAAADAASSGDVIRIAAGTYTPPAGQDSVLGITQTLTIQGGYRVTDWLDAQPFTFPTVFDAQDQGSTVAIDGDMGSPIEVTLEGLCLQGGQAADGGGVSGSGVQLTLNHCVLTGNTASGSGGGIYLGPASRLTISASRIHGNSAGDEGGGLAMRSMDGVLSLTRSWLYGNTAGSAGGGLSLSGGQAQMETTMLVDNTVTEPGASGAGLAAGDVRLTLSYVTLARNSGGAGMSLSGTSVFTATNVLAAGQTTALDVSAPGAGTVDGVLWGAGATWANGANTAGSGAVTVTHAYSGDPLFVGLDAANIRTYFHIAETSPARDRAVSTAADFRDIDTQPAYNTADLGADEYYSSAVVHVAVQAGGDIEMGTPDDNPENDTGAIFWNGTRWVTNSTAGHMYFTDGPTGDRLKQYTFMADVDGDSPAEQDIGMYHVVRTTYAYLAHARTGNGAYWIRAARYTLTVSGSDEVIQLDSRGSGDGQAYFDVYIQYVAGTTLAVRGGGALFTYALSPNQAARRPLDDPASQIGMLTTNAADDADRARYWLDADGGSDMGGLTYYFHAADLSTLTSALGSSFPDEFRIKYMQTETSTLDEFRLLPEVYSESPANTVLLPFVRR